MNWLGKLFKRKKSYSKDGKFKICIVDETKEHLHEIFGISEKRSDEITKTVLNIFENNNSLHECLVQIAPICKHENELVFAVLILNRILDHKKNADAAKNLLNLLKNG